MENKWGGAIVDVLQKGIVSHCSTRFMVVRRSKISFWRILHVVKFRIYHFGFSQNVQFGVEGGIKNAMIYVSFIQFQ